MLLTIVQTIDFSEDKTEDVVFVGEVNFYPQDGVFCSDIKWERELYSLQENQVIQEVADKMYDTFFEKFSDEVEEIELENSLP